MFKGLFGNANSRKLKSYQSRVSAINAHEAAMSGLSDADLAAKTVEYKNRFANGETLDSLLPEAFATVREAAQRVLGLRPYDVQLIGGMILHEGNIAEMRTGEGKTLTATMPVYLNALTGRRVYVVTVNDYLASRDAEWMGRVYAALGLRAAAIVPGQDAATKQAAYAADIGYATNNELAFDYLRDNMKRKVDDVLQTDHYFAIVDEVDSILIDEARTPLVISDRTPDRSELYQTIDKVIPSLTEDHFTLDEKSRAANLTEEGIDHVEAALQEAGLVEKGASLYDPEHTSLVHHVNMALVAHKVYRNDRHYLLKGGNVMLVDEFTGRVMDGRRLSNGLHQAIEAKEKVTIHPENVTVASVTYQNYFRLFEKLAGMTGTAMTEADEFQEIYNLSTIEVPTNLPIARQDDDDRIYRTQDAKKAAMIEEVKEAHAKGQPTLIGTTSIEASEDLSKALTSANIPHKVLNAKEHEQEANIIAKAGLPGAVTIATNMAGRGTDIQLGGNMDDEIAEAIENAGDGADPAAIREEVAARIKSDKEKALAAGGLFVIGTERHESRRIDNQLRGRSGRQGDPGRTLFFLSLDDDLMRIFGSDRMEKMVKTMGMKDDEAMEHPWLNKALERAQRKVEGRNFDIRKNLLKFDDIMNEQRKVIFGMRNDVLGGDEVHETADDMRHELIEDIFNEHIPERSYAEQWDVDAIDQDVRNKLNLGLPLAEWINEPNMTEDVLIERVKETSDAMMTEKRTQAGDEAWENIEQEVILTGIDRNWREHLEALDHLRSVINFRGYAQRDPFIEYKTESFEMFTALLDKIREESATQLSFARMMTEEEQLEQVRRLAEDPNAPPQLRQQAAASLAAYMQAQQANAGSDDSALSEPQATAEPAEWAKVGRNEACPCGSGKKYKHCHGNLSQS